MKTPICPTCSCSLVRLKISKDKAATSRYEGEEYHFCCQGCVDIFVDDPQKYLQEINDFIVCPTCLAEKPRHLAVKKEIAGPESGSVKSRKRASERTNRWKCLNTSRC